MRRHSENAVISQFQAIQIPVALQATEVRKYILQFLDNNKEQIVDFAEKAIHQYVIKTHLPSPHILLGFLGTRTEGFGFF